jgi:type VII secretion integral membrane protein EccD
MTTAASSPTRAGVGGNADVCRLTVNAPSGRTDLAVPAYMTVADLLPVLLTHAVEEEDLGSNWALQRLGEAPLDLEGTPETLGLRDGDILHLRAKDDLLSELCFDDIADGVATAVGAQPHRWQPRLTRGLCLGLACLALAALAALVVESGSDRLVPYTCGVLALGLIVGCGMATRVYGDRTAATITGLGACVFAGLAGRAGTPGPGLLDSRLDGLLAAAFVAAAAAAVLAFAQVPIVVFGTVLTLAGTAELGCWLSLALGWDAPHIAAAIATAMFALTPLAPRLALFAAKLRVVELPHNAQELQQGIDPLPESLVTRRAAAADGYLSVFFLSSAVVSTVAFDLLVGVPGWSSWVFTLVFSAVVLLRARDVGNARQRIALVTAGALGVILLVLEFQAHASAVARAGSMLVLFAVVALLLTGARKLPGARLRPIWGRLAEIMEGLLALALLPLLLQVFHTYAYFRALAG